jgi:O-methyltransferase
MNVFHIYLKIISSYQTSLEAVTKSAKWLFRALVVIMAGIGALAFTAVILYVIFTPAELQNIGTTAQEAPILAIQGPDTPETRYLELLKRVLTRYQTSTPFVRHPLTFSGKYHPTLAALYAPMRKLLLSCNLELVIVKPINWDHLIFGSGGEETAETAETMIGLKRLDNLQFCIGDVLDRGIPGDLIETGAWRGGACIFMRAVLKAYGVKDRIVWVADSFEGLPSPKPSIDGNYWIQGSMAVSLEEVKRNFELYNLLDDQVRFLKGWFKDTLPTAPIRQLAILRLDADLYESTMDAMVNLYPKLTRGGYVIVDDYRHPGCRRAIDEYRNVNNITAEIVKIDGDSVYWKKS